MTRLLHRYLGWMALAAMCFLIGLALATLHDAQAGGGATLAGGHAALQALQVPYATASPAPSTSAFITLTASTTGQTNFVQLYDSGGFSFYLSWAPTCAALATTGQNVLLIGANTKLGIPLYIPPLSCVGAKWIGTAASTGELDLTLLY